MIKTTDDCFHEKKVAISKTDVYIFKIKNIIYFYQILFEQ